MKIFSAAICALIAFIAGINNFISVSAEETLPPYAYVDLGAVAYLCSEKDEKTALFAIPQTYCVEIISKEDGWYKVKYAKDEGIYRAVFGFVAENDIIPTDELLEKAYLNLPVTVIYRTEAPDKISGTLCEKEYTAAYYGQYVSGKTAYSYVYLDGEFGYVSDKIPNGEYPLNPLPTAPTTAPATEKEGANAKVITAIAVTAIAAAAILILYFTGRKKTL